MMMKMIGALLDNVDWCLMDDDDDDDDDDWCFTGMDCVSTMVSLQS